MFGIVTYIYLLHGPQDREPRPHLSIYMNPPVHLSFCLACSGGTHKETEVADRTRGAEYRTSIGSSVRGAP